MKRNNNNSPFYPSAVMRGAAPHPHPHPDSQVNVSRVPHGFQEAMKRVNVKSNEYQSASTPEVDPKMPASQRSTVSTSPKWKSSFRPIGDHDGSSPLDGSPESAERSELYDPYNPVSPDSEHEVSRDQDHRRSWFKQDDNPEPQTGRVSKSRWDIPAPGERDDGGPENGPATSRAPNPGHRLPEQQTCNLAGEPFQSGYGSAGRSLDHRLGSPDRHGLGPSGQNIPAPYGPQRTHEHERIVPDYRGEAAAPGRPSPPRLKRNSQELGYFQTSMGEIPSRTKRLVMERIPVVCDLCDVELLDCQELQDHLESRTHWKTMERVQQENDYDDQTVAFLQEVMLHKSRRFSRPIEDSVLEALQENDHMTKVEVFHCTACETFISSSASSVRAHVMSQEHLTNIKRSDALQGTGCLARAQAMMEELKPQFQHFLKGGNPFD